MLGERIPHPPPGAAKEPGWPKVILRQSVESRIEPRRVGPPTIAPALVPASMSHPMLSEGPEHAQVGHAARGPSAQGQADPHTAQMMDEAFDASS